MQQIISWTWEDPVKWCLILIRPQPVESATVSHMFVIHQWIYKPVREEMQLNHLTGKILFYTTNETYALSIAKSARFFQGIIWCTHLQLHLFCLCAWRLSSTDILDKQNIKQCIDLLWITSHHLSWNHAINHYINKDKLDKHWFIVVYEDSTKKLVTVLNTYFWHVIMTMEIIGNFVSYNLVYLTLSKYNFDESKL